MASDVRNLIASGPMSRAQIVVIVACTVINMVDGFDVLVMAFAASSLAEVWSLTGSQLGVLLSAGLVGMAGGSVFLAPWADRIGRRPLMMLSLSMAAAGMLLAAIAQNFWQMTLLRLLTGIAIGGVMVCVPVIISEYASDKWRGFSQGWYSAGYGIGATLGGLIAIQLLTHFGWRSLFLFGAAVTAMMLPVVYAAMPESLEFLLTQRRRNTLQKLNGVLARLGHQPLTALPTPSLIKPTYSGTRFVQLFRPGQRANTVLLWLAYFAIMFGFYFVVSWTPRMLATVGLTAEQGVGASVTMSLGGILGSLTIGWLTSMFDMYRVEALCLLATVLTVVVFAFLYTELSLALLLAAAVGFLLYGAMAGLYAIGPTVYPVEVRSTGLGWAVGAGRVGAILSPLLAGALLDGGWRASAVYNAFAVPLLIAGAAILLLRRNRHGASPSAGLIARLDQG